jgi:hypothetical protein
MTGEKVLEVIQVYRSEFEKRGIPKQKCPAPSSDVECLAHLHAMLDQMEGFVKENRMGKVFRWLGFIQGALWRMGIYSLEELKNHNRP